MHDADYYYRQKTHYNNLIDDAEKQKIKIEELKTHLTNLMDIMSKIKSDLTEAEKSFSDGGFINNNETFDQGKINETCINIDTISNNIDNLLLKIRGKIIDLRLKINEYEKQYRLANDNYNKAQFNLWRE